jgi:uncharacterized protein YndB with AHSA1/START domain
MHFEASIQIDAPAGQVFDTWTDVERWPSWTSSVTRVEPVDRGPLKAGFRARVRQPRLPVALWQVTELVPGESFTWEARGRGLVTTASHRVAPVAGGVRATATLDQAGPLGLLVGLVYRRLTRRYLRTELTGLKDYCES